MRTVFVLFDSLNRHALALYGGPLRTPNLERLAARGAVFERHYVGSLPCMPARRDLHTGRLSFLHRSWGPLEPFDHSLPELLREHGVYSHLVSDHYHYFEDGGWTYHQRYASWDFVRGQEWDRWRAMVAPPLDRFQAMYHDLQVSRGREDGRLQSMINREFIKDEMDFPGPQVITKGIEFLELNRHADDWFLQIECFDPHEPFFAPARYRAGFPSDYAGPVLDWPRYKRVDETPAEIAEIRANYAALVMMCDHHLGRLLDAFDAFDLWRDTALVLTTDHGFLLGEHGWWAKNRMPLFQEISHVPLIVHHPALKRPGRRGALSQTIDLMPTFLRWHGVPVPETVEGRSLVPVLEQDAPVREAALFGMFGAATNVTDGRFVYFRYPPDMARQELYEYTLMPAHMKAMFTPEELAGAALIGPFGFTRGAPVLRVPARKDAKGRPAGHAGQGDSRAGGSFEDTTTALYDLVRDPRQERPLVRAEEERRLIELMLQLMAANEAPAEAYARLELDPPAR